MRCAGCGVTWRAHAEEPLELSFSAEEGAVATYGETSMGFDPPDLPAPEIPKAFRAKAEQRRRAHRAAATGVVWACLASGLVVLLTAAWLFRVDVVRLYPRAAGAYASIGLPVNPTGLEFRDVSARPAASHPGSVHVVGDIRNVDGRPEAIPPLRIALIDKKGARLAGKVLRLPAQWLAPGRSEHFSLMLPDPDAKAADVDVAFALDLMKRPRLRPGPRPSTAARPVERPRLRPSIGLRTVAPVVPPAQGGQALDLRGSEAAPPASHE